MDNIISVLELLVELATTAYQDNNCSNLLKRQPASIKKAYANNDGETIKLHLANNRDYLANETHVVQIQQ